MSGEPVCLTDRCPACGDAVGCGVASSGCWCAGVAVGADTIEALAERYEGCLCPSCLRKVAAGGVGALESSSGR